MDFFDLISHFHTKDTPVFSTPALEHDIKDIVDKATGFLGLTLPGSFSKKDNRSHHWSGQECRSRSIIAAIDPSLREDRCRSSEPPRTEDAFEGTDLLGLREERPGA